MYAFGEFVLDPQLYQLRRADQVVPLEPKVFDVLRYLLEHSERVATKRELLDALWPHEVVTAAVLPTNINALRRALGQKRGEKWPIETVHGRGYRFSMPVTRASIPAAASRSPLSSASPRRLEAAEPIPSHAGQSGLLEMLRRLLMQALAAQGQVCVLSGAAGSGKTHSAQQLCELARAHGADVWSASVEQPREAPALAIFLQLLRCALHSEGAETMQRWLGAPDSELGLLLPTLAAPSDAPTLGVERDVHGFLMLEAVLRVVSEASRSRPRVLWIEHMERADEASWQLLRLLAPQLERAAVLLIVSVRERSDLTVASTVERQLELLQRSPSCRRFSLRGLDVAEVDQLARVLTGGQSDRELAHALHARSGGNPLFVAELVHWLELRGRFDPAALRELPSLTPVELARYVLRRRVVRLGPDVQRILETAAVVGSRWDAAVVERACSMVYDRFRAALDRALSQRLIVQGAGRFDGYRFVHELLREALYDELAPRERTTLHLQAAAALEQRVAWLGSEGVREIAHHLQAALPEGDPEHASAWLERAARLCEEGAAYREAALLYSNALDAARLLPSAASSPPLSEERRPVLPRGARGLS